MLNLHGAELTVDGLFGSLTSAAVRSFQHISGVLVDGIIGSHTWSHLQAGCTHKEIKDSSQPKPSNHQHALFDGLNALELSSKAGKKAIEITSALNEASAHYFNATSSIMERRKDAVRNFVTKAQEKNTTISSPSMIQIACEVALSLATKNVGIATTKQLNKILKRIQNTAAKQTDNYIQSFVSKSLDTNVKVAAQNLGNKSKSSLGDFQKVQIEAIANTTRDAIGAFHLQALSLYSEANGVQQARALAEAYKEASKKAADYQGISTYAQWSKVVMKADKPIFNVFNSGHVRNGVMFLKYDVKRGLNQPPTSALMGGVSKSARNDIRGRTGTIGDLWAAGQLFRIDLKFRDKTVTLRCDVNKKTMTTVDGAAQYADLLVEYYQKKFGLKIHPELLRGSAENTANFVGHLIVSREILPQKLGSLPEIASAS